MARTRLRLGENLACVVYLHRWNYHKHLVFYSVVMQSINFFFLTHEIIWKTKRKKGIGTDFTESHKSRRDSNKQLFTLFYSQKKEKRFSIKTNLKTSLSKIKKKKEFYVCVILKKKSSFTKIYSFLFQKNWIWIQFTDLKRLELSN